MLISGRPIGLRSLAGLLLVDIAAELSAHKPPVKVKGMRIGVRLAISMSEVLWETPKFISFHLGVWPRDVRFEPPVKHLVVHKTS